MCRCAERSEQSKAAIAALKRGDLPGVKRQALAFAESIAKDVRELVTGEA